MTNTDSEKLKNKEIFSLFKEENNLKHLINKITEDNPEKLNDKTCIVSIIGKSDISANCCKAELIDETLCKNIFKGKFFEEKEIDKSILNEIEGYYDSKNNVIFLHLISPMDSSHLLKTLTSMSRKLKEKGFLNIWSDLNLNTFKAILLIFLISQIVVVVTPSIQIDICFLQIFRLIDQFRSSTQSKISELLKEIPNLSKNWILLGRPCSPRVFFVFELYFDELSDSFNQKTDLINHIIENKRRYELDLEDQIYRFMRKSRIITNICSNALFAICNQADFVYISTDKNSIRDSKKFFNELLYFYCGKGKKPLTSKNICNELLSLDIDLGNDNKKERTFYDFLWSHINTALTKGFDDNVGRHNIIPIFELPDLKTFYKVVFCLKKYLFDQPVDSKVSTQHIPNKFDLAFEYDNLFSESRCRKMLPIAFNFYRDKLPKHYTKKFHEQKLDQTLQFYKTQARGLSTQKYFEILENDCNTYWKTGHQVCGELSLFENSCINPVHKTKKNNVYQDESEKDEKLSFMEHCSGVKFISACNCGLRQANREDPFTIKQANFDFYYNLAMKCCCQDFTSFQFPIFEGSISKAKPAELTSRMFKLAIEEDSCGDEEDSYEEEEGEDEDYSDDNSSDDRNTLSSDKVDCKIQTQLESQPFQISQPDYVKSTDENFSNSDKAKKNKNSENTEITILDKSKSENDNEVDENSSSNTTANESNADEVENVSLKKKKKSFNENLFSKTEYLDKMLNSRSPKNLLPLFDSWSLVCLGPSSIYSHNLGIQNQPGFISGTNYLLPWDVTVKLEHLDELPKVWHGRKLPGIKKKKVLQDGTQFTIKVFIGIEYECLKGHRFICSKPNTVLKAQFGQVKETAKQIISNDMPLFMACACRNKDEELAQLMRIHIVTPKAPVYVTLNPQVQISSAPFPVFFPMYINENNPDKMIKLTQSSYWVLRLPFVYQQENNFHIIKKYSSSLNTGKLLKDCYGICKYISKSNFSKDQDKVGVLNNLDWV